MAYSYPWVENGGVNAPSKRSLRDCIQADKVRAQEPSSMSLREHIRNNGLMDPMTPVYNPGWPAQSHFVRGYEGTFSPHYLAPHQSYQPPFERFEDQPSSSGLPYYIQEHDAYPTPPNEPLGHDTLEDTFSLFRESQEEVNSKVDKALNDIKSQLTLLIQTLVGPAEDESLIPSPSILAKKEEFEIEDSKQGETREDFGLSNVGDSYVQKDDVGLEVIPIISIGHEIYTFPPLAPSPTFSGPLELPAPTLEPIILHTADHQQEGEGQVLHSMSFIGTSVHDHFISSAYSDPFYPSVHSCYIIEFSKEVAIVYLSAYLNSLKLSRLNVGDDGKFPPCGIG